ncbi:MAG: GNAT family N-acetyltransferase [Candidatus Nanopelagicales bacterium]
MSFEVRRATRDDIPEAAAILARAFSNDPAAVWLVPLAQARQRRLTAVFVVLLRRVYLPLGYTDVALKDGLIVAVAAWAPPGKWKPPLHRLALAAPGMLKALGPRMRAGEELEDALENHHPARPHWYLQTLGTAPGLQLRGAATALLAQRIAKCDANGMPIYMDTANPANIAIMARFGFAKMHTIEIGAGAPDHIGLWREPAPRTDG